MKKTSWGFDTTFINPSVRPQDDFYHYAVGGWLKSAKIPENESRWGSFNILRHRTDVRLKKLLHLVSKKRGVKQGSPEQLVRDVYRAAVDMKGRNALGTKPIEPERELIKDIDSRDALKKAIIELHAEGTGGLWGVDIDQDMKKSDRYALYLYQGGLALPEREYYLKDGQEQKRVRRAYRVHIKKLLGMAGYMPQSAAKAATTVMRVETALAQVSMKKEDCRVPHKVYHKHALAELKKLAPGFDWSAYFKRLGTRPSYVIVMQPDFISKVVRLIDTLPLSDWKTYLDWHVVNDAAGALTTAFEKQQFAFYGAVLSGTRKMKPRWRQGLGTVNGVVGEPLGKLYVKHHFGAAAKRKVNRIVDDLIAAYERRIKDLDWMGSATKEKALGKLRAMKRKLGYPNKWRSYRGLVVKPDDHFGNLRRSHAYELAREVKKLGKPIDRTEWFVHPHEVNAYYAPVMNDIVFPAGILQHPFFDLDADDAVNYGAMGMVIGHELTHGFDDQGAEFDAKGNLKNWWAKKDKEQFTLKSKVLKRQYGRFAVEGLPVNGTLTLGENIADLGGLIISYHAYTRKLKRGGRKEIRGFTPEQRFFLAYAQSEHELSRPESIKLRILTDSHSPSECRVNGPLANMTEFYDAFDVKPGDALYRPPAKRAKIW